MRTKLLLSLAAAATSATVAPAIAAAEMVELGQTKSPLAAPVCPPGVSAKNCTIVLTRATALATIRDGTAYPTKVKRHGYVVAFTVGLSALTPNRGKRKTYIHNLDSQFGGPTLLQLTVLQPFGARKDFKWQVVASSPSVHVQPYLGYVVQFPLQQALEVKRGDVVALTTTTWAPVLSIKLDHSTFAYRQSRSSNCDNPPVTQHAQLSANQRARYKCNYPGTRVEYTATEVIDPPYPKNYVHARNRRARDLSPKILRRG